MKALLLTSHMRGFNIETRNGVKGKVEEFLFDDNTWDIRHVVVAINGWWNGRKVLLSPESLQLPNWKTKRIPTTMSTEEVERSPDVSTGLPAARVADINIARAAEIDPFYPEAFIGRGNMPDEPANSDSHLRSTGILAGVVVRFQDGTNLGTVEDFVLDSTGWRIPYMLLHCQEGGMMLFDTSEVQSIDFSRREMMLKDSANKLDDFAVGYDPRYTIVMSSTNE